MPKARQSILVRRRDLKFDLEQACRLPRGFKFPPTFPIQLNAVVWPVDRDEIKAWRAALANRSAR